MNKLIRYNEEAMIIEYRYRKMKYRERVSNNAIIQYEEIQEILDKRKLTMINRQKLLSMIIINETIIQLAIEFTKEKELKLSCFDEINHVRLHEK